MTSFSEVPAHRRASTEASAAASLSLLVPGLSQALQRRWVSAIIHLGAVLTYLSVAVQADWGRAAWLALMWNVWSGIDAWWHERTRVTVAESASSEHWWLG